jgi:hypothetical protein
MSTPALPHCDNRDKCPCWGPSWVCVHGYFGAKYGREDTTPGAVGPVTIYRVTADDCLRCEADGERQKERDSK